MQVTQEQTFAETGTEQCRSMTTYRVLCRALKLVSRITLKARNSDACLSGQALKAYKN